jgi:transcription antitermination factor NusG
LTDLFWFALQVRPRCEKLVSASLTAKGYEAFLPLYRSRRCWSDRTKELELPLFDCYVFCRLNVEHRLPVLIIPGVLRFVGIGKMPLPVAEAEIAALQTIVRSGAAAEPWPHLRVGQRVCIEHGPLRGVEGMLVEVKGFHRLVVSVSLLQRSVAVEIDREWVNPVLVDEVTSHRASP